MTLTRILIVCALVGSTSLAFASGGYSRGGSSNFNPKPVDRTYEYGKSVFKGRVKGVSKTPYCIDNGTEKVKLKGKSIKAFRGSTVTELASNLYDCNNPDKLIASTLSTRNLEYVIYYLNKRYKLKLK